MARTFDIPVFYRSPIISVVKNARKLQDPRRRDYSPSVLDFGPVRFHLARHFGFCFGVENAIEIAYRAVEQHPDKRIFLLSEMIHNPHVNQDLRGRGVQFVMTTSGQQLVRWDDLSADDIVIVPAFGTTLEIQQQLSQRGIDPYRYDTTCPFVEKVWNRTATLGERDCTVVVHGKWNHEETRATFSHSRSSAPTVVVENMEETERLAAIIEGREAVEKFEEWFRNRSSEGFNPATDLNRIGVVNQTTMLAQETQAIADRLRQAMLARYGPETIAEHFADTRDTLCYATNENQGATSALIASGGDLAIVVGGYNSSNTSHLVELCQQKMPTYFIRDAGEILSQTSIRHFDIHTGKEVLTEGWLPVLDRPIQLVLTSGASCPDALVDAVIQSILTFYPTARSVEEALGAFQERTSA
ncbi:MAG: 4-hydroxy-3-methylbut-2-enyl diphosphate reductase [Armatimonadetes bacterium]|nr:4-hydroxy-3-methylbut-2-enyl diphosphate reductase [Armatimonadota bacterium]